METKTYTPPTAEVLEVSIEGVFCISDRNGQTENYDIEDFVW